MERGASLVKRNLLIVLVALAALPGLRAQSPPGPPMPVTESAVAGSQEFTLPLPQGATPCAHPETSKQRFGPTALHQLMHILTAPLRLACGGRLGACHAEVPSAEDIARLPSGCASPAEAAAAKIKVEEAGAKARRASVRYLRTVDCHYYPEAEAALIAALRADRNEGVRLEAAFALGNGCCCTKKTMDALNLVVSGGEQDGNPAETSERIKQASVTALEHSMARGVELAGRDTSETLPPLRRTQAAPAHLQPANYTVPFEPKTNADPVGGPSERCVAPCIGTPKLAATPPPGLRGLLQGWFNNATSHDAPTGTYRRSGLAPIGVVPGE